MGQIVSLGISVLFPGHTVFYSLWRLQFFCPVLLIHVGVPGILAPKLGIKAYYAEFQHISVQSELLFWKRWTSREGRMNRSQLLLIKPAGVTSEAFQGNANSHCEFIFKPCCWYCQVLCKLDQVSNNWGSNHHFLLTYKLHECEL